MKTRKTCSRPIYISSVPRDKVTAVLRVGQILRGTVIEQLAEDLYIINFRGFNLNSRARARLKRGKNIYVRVTDIGEKIIMRLLPEDEYREAQNEANLLELDYCLENIGITPNYLNRFIAGEMLRFQLPLSRSSFEKVLDDATHLELDDANDTRALVFLTARKYPGTRGNIELAAYMDFPCDSKLLGELMNMREREPEEGDGLPIRVFDDDEKSAVCFRYQTDNLGALKVLAVIKDTDVQTEIIVEDMTSKMLFLSNEYRLGERLRKDGLDLKRFTALLEENSKESYGNRRLGIPIGIDFRA